MRGDIPATKLIWTWTPLQDVTSNIVIFTLFCDIFDQILFLLKYWKNVNFDFTINLIFAFAFFNFLFILNKINALLLHTCRVYLLKI